jgi:pimeloyl-ACP methyl ester carboxylesterase
MLQLSTDTNLSTEPLDTHVSGHLRMEHLYDNGAAERGLERQEDAAHAAAAELPLDPVAIAEGFLELFAYIGHATRPPRKCSANVDRRANPGQNDGGIVVIYSHHQPAAADTLRTASPNAKKVVIPNAGHGAHFAQPLTFNSALLDFFYAVERTKKH